jgi:glycine/D-amino acid oxidase-like deaminating enzyme
MKQTGGTSYWVESTAGAGFPALDRDLEVDVAIIGGGLAGTTCAYLLKRAGKKVAVIEKETIGGGVTGHTTGKVTSQHGLVYAKLRDQHGEAAARVYGEANQAAIRQIRENIAHEKIDCDWQADDNFVYTESAGRLDALRREAEVAQSLGLPATFETRTTLPFEVSGAVKFSGQGKLHARKYVLGLAAAVEGAGSYVFEHTAARSVREGNPAQVKTAGGTVRARHVIIATNVPYPAAAHTYYGAFEYPMRSYLIAARFNGQLKGMYITPDQPLVSILPIRSGSDQLLLIGGQSHFVGFGGRSQKHYAALADFAKQRFGVTDIAYRWSAFDYLAYDGIPLAGHLYPWSKHVYVATGFMKWGLTNTTVSAMILRDLILGRTNPWAATFASNRSSAVKAIPGLILGRK